MEIISKVEAMLRPKMEMYEHIALCNQEKVLDAFIKCNVSSSHFSNTTGYGYGDMGRDKLSQVFAEIFGTESAIVSPHFASGTHAIMSTLFGILRPTQRAVCISGMPYDTLKSAIFGKGIGSLQEFGITFDVVELTKEGKFDDVAITNALETDCDMVYLQRSPGYTRRRSFTISQIADIIKFVRKHTNAPIVVDNCYGEFVELQEPTNVGADIIVGSLIKNAGGSIAPTGGYVAGKAGLVDKVGMRLTAPGIGVEVGSYEGSYRTFYQGVYMAPHVVLQALKGGLLVAGVMEKLGYNVFPPTSDEGGDIVKVIDFLDKDRMVKFCQAVQAASPVDSFAVPEASYMPGYDDDIIMASGSFVQGSSIELSADAPIRPPYTLYVQGGVTYEHIKIAISRCIKAIS